MATPKRKPRLTAQIIVLVNEATKDQIVRVAQQSGVSIGAVVRAALRRGLPGAINDARKGRLTE